MTSISNPVGAAKIMPPVMQQPMMPFTIKIEITPNYPMAQAPYAQPDVIYNIPQTSLYGDKPKVEEKKAETAATDNANVAKTEQKQDNKDVASTMAKVLAAEAGIKPVNKADTAKEAKPAEGVKAETKAEVKHNKPEIVPPETMKPGINLDALLSILNSSDYEEQADALEAMSEVAIFAPEKGGEMLDSKVVDSLTEIMTKDTSKLQGEEKKAADRNKEYAMFTTATLQKMFADEVKKTGNVDVPAKDLIGIEPIVKNLATNPNESVREAAVASLGYATNPANKKDMSALLNAAAGDVSPVVRAQANKQLSRVSAQ